MNNKTFMSIALVLFGLFILILFTKEQIFSLSVNREENKTLISERDELKTELEYLENIQKYFTNGNTVPSTASVETKKDLEKYWNEVSKYTNDLQENELLDFIYGEIFAKNKVKVQQIKINNLQISKATESQIWFKESNVTLSVTIQSENSLRDILNILVDNEKYKFFIKSLSYEVPEPSAEWTSQEMQITIPLQVFYK